jgi:hypothetical protein
MILLFALLSYVKSIAFTIMQADIVLLQVPAGSEEVFVFA